jgi:hypothetical protein
VVVGTIAQMLDPMFKTTSKAPNKFNLVFWTFIYNLNFINFFNFFENQNSYIFLKDFLIVEPTEKDWSDDSFLKVFSS